MQFPCPNRSVCLHRRGRPLGRPGGMTEEPHMLWANPRHVRCGFAQGFFRKRKCRCEGRYPPEGGKAGKTYPPAPVCALGHPPLGKGGLPGCRGRQPLRRKDSARRSDPQGCPDPPLCWVQDPSSALPPQDDSAARCAGRRGHPEERETRDVPSSAHPHAVTTGTSSVIRLAGDRRMPPSPCAGKAFGGRSQVAPMSSILKTKN